MKKVITYGTYDLLHYGHIRLLQRAKELGDYLIVGVTADDFDIKRGKINVQQSLIERIEAVRATGIADEIIVEEYEGQKIDDIQKFGVDIFTVGSDWVGKFDYLNEFCQVIYLDRTQGVSSSGIRSASHEILIGIISDANFAAKFINECQFVNGAVISGIFTSNESLKNAGVKSCTGLDEVFDTSDAVYVASHPSLHYTHIKSALLAGKHVIYEPPMALTLKETDDLIKLANANHCILYAGIKTAYATAYSRMILMAKSGKIGEIVSVDAVCTSLNDDIKNRQAIQLDNVWDSITAWGPTAMLPVFQLLGTAYIDRHIVTRKNFGRPDFDTFSKIDWIFPKAVASIKVGIGVKAEGEMIIAGTDGYLYIPAPWWKTDYFEIRYENQTLNRRFFYQLEGEGIRNMIVSFVKSITQNKIVYIKDHISRAISETVEAAKANDILI